MHEGEEKPCILCHQTETTPLFLGRDRMHGVDGEFMLTQCKYCGLVWVSPGLSAEELDKYYPKGYICYAMAIEDETNPLLRKDRQFGVEKRARRVIAKTAQPGKVLDIGCATGIFLNAMKQHGWDCYGVEPSPYASEYAKSRMGLNVFTGFLDDSPYPDSFFDVVTLWDVFEHLPDPRKDLKKIWKLLKPGGQLVICTPNSDSWDRSLFGKYWVGWEVPRHYYIYGQRNLTKLLAEEQYNVENVSSFTGRHGVLTISFQFWIDDQSLPTLVKKGAVSAMQSIFARAITYPYFMLADRINKSAIMTVFARKHV